MKFINKFCVAILSCSMIGHSSVFGDSGSPVKVESKKAGFKTALAYTTVGIGGLIGLGLLVDYGIKQVNRNKVMSSYGTLGWKERYVNIDETKELHFKDYRKFYVSQASDGRCLHGCQFDEFNTRQTRRLNKKFITSVMERRFAHLQQVKYCIKFFIEKTSDDKAVERVLDEHVSRIEKSLDKDEREKEFKKFCEEWGRDSSDKKVREAFESLHSIDERKERISELKNIKQKGGFNKDRATLLETYNLIDEILKVLSYCPEKISNLKFSDASINRINDIFKGERYDSIRGTHFILGAGYFKDKTESDSKNYEPFMITLDEPTDRILAMLENYAYDGDNTHRDIENFCTAITSIPNNLAYMEEFCIAKLPESRSLPNPYRGKYGVY